MSSKETAPRTVDEVLQKEAQTLGELRPPRCQAAGIVRQNS